MGGEQRGPRARAVAISAGISSGRPISGPIRSRARVWTAIAETSVPITASAEVGEQQHRDQARQRAVRAAGPSSSSANAGTAITSSTTRYRNSAAALASSSARAVDRREQEGVEPALLALGDEQAVDPEHRREQQRAVSTPAASWPSIVRLVEAEVEDHERDDREQRHRRHRLERRAARAAGPCAAPPAPSSRVQLLAAARRVELARAGRRTPRRPSLSASTRSASASAALRVVAGDHPRARRRRGRSAARPARSRPGRGSRAARRAAAASGRAAPRGRPRGAAPSRARAAAPARRRGAPSDRVQQLLDALAASTPCSRAW